MRITMYPPPPRLPAKGNVTASANPVATAASTALPPAFMISSPAALASALLLATTAVDANVPCSPGLNRHSAGNEAGTDGTRQLAGSVATIAGLPSSFTFGPHRASVIGFVLGL